MATAFYGTITIKRVDGKVQTDRFDNTDVTLAFSTFTSAGGNTFLTVLADGWITDIATNITAAGTTKDFKLWINQTDTNIRWVQSLSFGNLYIRYPNSNPIPVRAGDVIMLQAI